MIVGIHQPNYIPWLGYFYKILKCDVFVFLDNAPFSKNSLQNRNRIKTPQGVVWLTQPVLTKGKFGQLTSDVFFSPKSSWRDVHLKTFNANYRKAPYFKDIFPKLEEFYHTQKQERMAEFNQTLIKWVCRELELNTTFYVASKMNVSGKSTDLLVDICLTLGADTYLSGTGGRNYQEEKVFEQAGIQLAFTDFHFPSYRQCWNTFIPNISVIDLLFNVGSKKSREILLSCYDALLVNKKI